MAVFPKRIVQKNSTDSISSVKAQVSPEAGTGDAIVAGEIVLQRANGSANLIALDSNNNPVVVGQTATEAGPALLLNFEESNNGTPVVYTGDQRISFEQGQGLDDVLNTQRTFNSPGKFGLRSFRTNDSLSSPNPNIAVTDRFSDESIGIDPWTLQFWIRGNKEDWIAGKKSGLILCKTDYLFGPGAFTVYLDGGTPDNAFTHGTSTSQTTDVAHGAVVFGLRMPKYSSVADFPSYSTAHGNTDPLIPPEGEIVHSGNISVLDGEWNHVCISHEGEGAYAMFVNGVEVMRKVLTRAINHDDPGLSGVQQPSGWSVGGALVRNDLLPLGVVGSTTNRGDDYGSGGEWEIDSISLHAGIAIYRGLHQIPVPTTPPTLAILREPIYSLQTLPDTDIDENPIDGAVLQYNSSRQLWESVAAPGYDISGNNLTDLGDVNIQASPAALLDKEVLSWDQASSKWQNVRLSPDQLFGVEQPNPFAASDKGFLIYEKAEEKWEFRTLYKDDLNFETVEFQQDGQLDDGQFLTWSDFWGKWVNSSLDASHLNFDLEDLDDVTRFSSHGYGTAQSSNVILSYNGYGWVSQVTGQSFLKKLFAKAIDEAGDTLADGAVLKYNAVTEQWEQAFGLEADISSNEITDLLDVDPKYNYGTGSNAGQVEGILLDFSANYEGILFGTTSSSSNQPARLEWKESPSTVWWTDASLTLESQDTKYLVDRRRATTLQLGGVLDEDDETTGAVLALEYGATNGSQFEVRGYSGGSDLQPSKHYQLVVIDESDKDNPGIALKSNVGGYSAPRITFRADFSNVAKPFQSQTYTLPYEPPASGARSILTSDFDGSLEWIQQEVLDKALDDLTDVNLGSAAIGDSLVFNGSEWVATQPNAISQSVISDLSDVTFADNQSARAVGTPLVWNGAAWSVGQVTGIDLGSSTINELSDVSTTGADAATDGAALVFDQSRNLWVPNASLGASAIDELADVDTTSGPPVEGQALVWNGTTWVPGNVATSGGGSADGYQLAVPVQESQTTSSSSTPEALIFTGIGGHGHILRAEASANCWVVLYTRLTMLTADASRAYGVAPSPNSGVIGEFTLNANELVEFTPAIHYFNNQAIPQDEIFALVRTTAGAALPGETLTLEGIGTGVFESISGGSFGSG